MMQILIMQTLPPPQKKRGMGQMDSAFSSDQILFGSFDMGEGTPIGVS
jgi:hypothetical protein